MARETFSGHVEGVPKKMSLPYTEDTRRIRGGYTEDTRQGTFFWDPVYAVANLLSQIVTQLLGCVRIGHSSWQSTFTLSTSISSSSYATNNGDPASALSSSFPVIFTPCAASISLNSL